MKREFLVVLVFTLLPIFLGHDLDPPAPLLLSGYALVLTGILWIRVRRRESTLLRLVVFGSLTANALIAIPFLCRIAFRPLRGEEGMVLLFIPHAILLASVVGALASLAMYHAHRLPAVLPKDSRQWITFYWTAAATLVVYHLVWITAVGLNNPPTLTLQIVSSLFFFITGLAFGKSFGAGTRLRLLILHLATGYSFSVGIWLGLKSFIFFQPIHTSICIFAGAIVGELWKFNRQRSSDRSIQTQNE